MLLSSLCTLHVSLRAFLLTLMIPFLLGRAGTAKEVAAAAFDAGVRQGKTCIVVKDVPGFYVNRALCMSPALGTSLLNMTRK